MSLADAERLASGYVLQVAVGPEIAGNLTMQTMLLAVVNTAARAFPGGVRVRDDITDQPRRHRGRHRQTEQHTAEVGEDGQAEALPADDRCVACRGVPGRTPLQRPR
jgi:hypothetical protein